MPGPWRAAGDWLDERVGWRALVKEALEEPLPGGARWAYIFGSLVTFVLVSQMVTGVLLASYYSPSTTTAWASVAYIQDQATLAWLVRGLHSTGASAMVILLGLHLFQVAIWGAYKRPREMNWIFGVLLFGLTFGFALTGYLLPWDQKGYWATQVATSLAGATPVVGHALQTLVQGGTAYGNLTLTHFYALHVFVLPAAVIGLTVIHIGLLRRHGVTPAWDLSAEELERRTQPFWPDQMVRDAAGITLVLGAMLWSTLASHGADLEAPADPASSYDARPEWYFLPLFQLLKYFPGKAEVPAALGLPLVVGGTLLALPFLDRKPDRNPARRLPYLGAVVAIFAGAILLGVIARREDAASKSYQAQVEKAKKQSERARELAKKGMPPAGGVAVYENDPDVAVLRLFEARCAGCHVFHGDGKNEGPELDGWGSEAYVAALLKDPDAPRFFGKSGVKEMKPAPGTGDELRTLAAYVVGLGPGDGRKQDEAERAKGEALFKDGDCDSCHEIDGSSAGSGPNLGGWGTEAYLVDLLRDPGTPRFFGKRNKMPRFGDKLSDAELASLAKLIARERHPH